MRRRKFYTKCFISIIGLFIFLTTVSIAVGEGTISGKVVKVSGTDVGIEIEESHNLDQVSPGDKVKLLYVLKSSDKEMDVGTWQVTDIRDGLVWAKALESSHKPRKGLKAVIYVGNAKRSDAKDLQGPDPGRQKKPEKKGKPVLQKTDESAEAEKYFQQGVKYYDGVGPDRDLKRAASSLRKAADLGHCKAALYLVDHNEGGQRVEDHAEEFIRWLKLAADLNCVEPQFWLGQVYDGGLQTENYVIKPDRSQAIHWYGLAAANGHPKAKIRLGQLKGKSVSNGSGAR